ncbi:TlpA disulfide reductase family protein [uncultured Maribacter sp.]|uniref:TlpA family protein disulfide reductase n=1 Tax=uncultured Maribacter sp. TaxID=431308 RepID=UPI00260931AB|nr:TlpA disulfide reductase family protein [uncultured Maribacter sp.]
MQKYILVIVLAFLVYGFSKDESLEISTIDTTINDEIVIHNFESLEPLLYTDSNKVHVVNFWAMWCAPCIKELPVFKEYENNNDIEMIFVSLDFPEDIETKLKPFLKRKGITSKVVLLDDPDANSWIDKIDPNWSGAIPFTIIFNKDKRTYHERPFENLNDLENEIHKTFN